MNKRIATMSIFVENRDSIANINKILMDFSEDIISRMGIPHRKMGLSVIVLILETNNDRIGSLSGKIGNLSGVSVKTASKK